MNASQLAALTEQERVQVTHISAGTRPNTLVEMVQDFATALADARLEVARLTEERDNWRANCDALANDATREYQNWARRHRKAGGGEASPKLRAEWLRLIYRLHRASDAAIKQVAKETK